MNNKKNINCERGCIFNSDEETSTTQISPTLGGFKLNTTDWIEPMKISKIDKIYEVRFKNTRKAYFENVNELPLKVGDIVAVEGSHGHDIGIVSMCEDMVRKYSRNKQYSQHNQEYKKIYRMAKPYDIERWQEAISLEHPTMIKSRQIVADLRLNMKIGDVEYQGDRVKAIFYYIADERVDFRELIKILADEFKVRIEMKQIGARQEAGRIGGIGSCGRELCCSSFVTNFVSVTTNSARFQDIVLNPQKLAGQCGKLKCCMNFEVDSYIDARKGFPKISGPLQTKLQDYFLVKTDIFKGEMTFSSDPHLFVNVKVLSVDTVKDIMSMNRRGVRVDDLINETVVSEDDTPDYINVVGDDSITRFDKKIVKKAKKRRPNSNNKPRVYKQNDDSADGENRQGEPDGNREGSERQSNRPRPEGDGANGQRPEGRRPRPEGDRANNPRPEGRRPRPDGERSNNPRPEGRRPRPEGERVNSPRPEGEGANAPRPEGRRPRPEGERSNNPRPEGRKPRPDGERSNGPRPEGEGANNPRPEGRKPRPDGERSNAPRPEGEGANNPRPEGRRPRPDGERNNRRPRPDGERSNNPRPEGRKPRPEGEKPTQPKPTNE